MSSVSVLRGVLPLNKQNVINDVLAGITLAALGILKSWGTQK
jgi:hypothetical protein